MTGHRYHVRPMNTIYLFIQSYTHDGRIGVLVEFEFELLVTANEPEFITTSKDIAMHIAALAPRDVESLLAQPFVRDAESSVAQRLLALSAHVEDRVRVKRYVRWSNEVAGPTERQPEPPGAPAMALRG